MKKIFLLSAYIVSYTTFGQIGSKDNSFATNGIYSIPSTVSGIPSDFSSYWSRMVQNQDGSVYFTYNKENPAGGLSKPVVLSKINPAGVIDTTFGVNGEAVADLNSLNSYLQKQADGKLLIIGFNPEANIVRFLPNGQLDSSFGNNGTSTIPNLGADTDLNNYGLFLQNNKIIIYGRALDNSNNLLPYLSIYRLNEDGNIDTTFGSNGSINTQGKFVFIDSQSNIISLTTSYPNNSKIEKYDSSGQPVISFGNNGILDLTFSLVNLGTAIIDSNDNIVYSTMDGEIGRITPNGVLDTSFTFDSSSLPFPIWIFSIIEKNASYYVGGVNQTDNKYFISRLTQNGTIDPVFNYFVETNANLTEIGDMIINNDNIIVNGGGYIAKYLSNTTTLSTMSNNIKADTNKDIIFKNPVNQHLVFYTKKEISKIDIYDLATGELLKTVVNSNSNMSSLISGKIYIAKVTFKDGEIISKKLLKN